MSNHRPWGENWWNWFLAWHRFEEGGGLWFRCCGYGAVIRDPARHPMLFSERAGLSWWFMLGRWMVKPLLGWSRS